MTKHGNTYLGRYEVLERSSELKEEYRWPISQVLSMFHSDITDVLSMGCSVGINEVILAIQHPQIKVTAIDINPESIAVARSGVWDIEDIRPNIGGFQQVYDAYCPKEHFVYSGRRLRLLKAVENIRFECQDARRLLFPNSGLDLIMSHFFAGDSTEESMLHYLAGLEVERVLRNGRFFWHQLGLFRYYPRRGFYRLVHYQNEVRQEEAPINRNELFPLPQEPTS